MKTNAIRLMMPSTASFACMGFLAFSDCAKAQEPVRRSFEPRSVAQSECMCRANGAYFREGEQACVWTPDGRRVSLCGRDQNVLTWQPSQKNCPES
jgi:hypothetical protein